MQHPNRYLITSALPYANGPLHIGHIAGAYLPADIYVRYLRRRQRDVVFICGSDEHGAAITIQAKKENTTPQAIIDKYHQINKDAFAGLGISFDIYHRTSAPIHHATSQEFFLKLHENGVFEERESEQLYDEQYQQFLADRYIVGTCPVCGNPNAYGDQCEKCGTSLSPTDLINPVSTLSNQPPVKKITRHWYLPLNKFAPWLKDWIIEGNRRTEEWKKNVLGQCASWLNEGLHPRAITRDLDWGVKVPLPGADGKVLYVWLDAPIGYISATKQWAIDHNRDWKPYWQSPDTKLVHFIGKDNIVFHCLIFPCILKSHGEYILPANVPANEFMNMEGDKMSTSRNWSIQLHKYLEEFPGKEDVLRYVLCANMPETKDSEFTWKDFQARNNNELAAIYGNFINRVVVLTNKYYNGIVPSPNEFNEVDQQTLAELKAYPAVISSSIERYRFREALGELMNVARLGNKYLADEEPWKMVKENPERVQTQMYVALQIASALAILSEPFLPFTAKKLCSILNIKPNHWNLGFENWNLVKAGHQIGQAEILFAQIEDAEIQKQIDKLEATKSANDKEIASSKLATIMPQKETATFDDFQKIDLRIGTIIEAEKMPKADKLLVLKVDTGIDVRTIVSGIAEHFSPEEVIGKRVTVLVNLAPRALRGVESQGMLLLTNDTNGKLVFVNPDAEGVNNGAVIS